MCPKSNDLRREPITPVPGHSLARRVNQDLDRGSCKASRVTDFSLKDVNIRSFSVRGRVAPKVTQYDLRNVFLPPDIQCKVKFAMWVTL